MNLILTPKSRVRVSKLFGAAAVSLKFLPRPMAEHLNRALGADHVFLDGADTSARRAYEERARRS